jgi:hypothetical protein
MAGSKVKVSPMKKRRGDWIGKLLVHLKSDPGSQMHLAVLQEPYLSLILSGDKRHESRFSRTRRAPYRAIEPGDLILLKQDSGPIVGTCRAGDIRFFDLDEKSLPRLRRQYSDSLCVNDQFWRDRVDVRFATIIELRDVMAIDPVPCFKRDQCGWVILSRRRRRPNLQSACAHRDG